MRGGGGWGDSEKVLGGGEGVVSSCSSWRVDVLVNRVESLMGTRVWTNENVRSSKEVLTRDGDKVVMVEVS